jgi:hypothetical protein
LLHPFLWSHAHVHGQTHDHRLYWSHRDRVPAVNSRRRNYLDHAGVDHHYQCEAERVHGSVTAAR